MLFPAMLFAKREEPLLRAGIISDISITAKASPMDSVFKKTLEYFLNQGVDAVVITGDFLTNGTEEELAKVSKLWFSVFPEDKGIKGKHVERIFIYGEHEIEGHNSNAALKRYSPEYLQAFNIALRRSELWEKYFNEPFKPYYRKEVNGFVFLASHYDQEQNPQSMTEFFASQQTTLPGIEKPVFYIQHRAFQKNDPVLSYYPNLICLSGGNPATLTDEKSIWQDSYTYIGTSSLSQVTCRDGRENSDVQDGYVAQMQKNKLWHGHHGMLMTVYSDRVEFNRYDFHSGESLGIWNIPTDVKQRPYNWGTRRLDGMYNTPIFPKGSIVEVVRKKDRNRNGAQVKQVHLNFPTAVSLKERPRAFDYKVSVELMTSEVVLSKRVYSLLFYLCERRDKEKGATCRFAESELPKAAPFRFVVRPVDSFENEGEPIYSEYLVLYEND